MLLDTPSRPASTDPAGADRRPSPPPSASSSASSHRDRAPSAEERFERSSGHVEIAFKRHGSATTLARLHQVGCGKVRLPRPAEPGHAEAVLVNLAGGLTGGDRLTWRATWRCGAMATVSGQAAEKIYRAVGRSHAVIDTALAVEADATALWLPQETILFDRARLRRRNRFEVARGGRLLALEATILGRQAMGETVASGLFDETVEIRYAGRLLLAERQRFQGPLPAFLARPAIARGARAMASLVHVGEAAADRLETVRAALGDLAAVASAPDADLLVVRWLERSPDRLRKDLAMALFALQRAMGLPARLPRVWSC